MATPAVLTPPYDYGYLPPKASSEWPMKFLWLTDFSPSPDHITASVRFRLTITYTGGSTTSE